MLMAAKRPRISFDSPENIRRAINMWAARTGRAREEWLKEMVERHLPKELAEADKAIADEAAESAKRPKR